MAAPVFFTPTDLSGALTGWSLQSDSISQSSDRASALISGGDEDADAVVRYNIKRTASCTMKCFLATGDLTLPSVGSVIGEYVVESFSLDFTPGDWPSITIQLHAHGSTGAHGAVQTYTPSMTFACARGIPSTIGGGTLAATSGYSAFSYSITATHIDEKDGLGEDTLACENHDGVESVSCTVIGSDVPAMPVESPVWESDTTASNRDVAASDKYNYAFSRHLQAD
jgi:hypothetical protein